jgi:Ni,Fe-hydrogenase I large subunit
MKLSVVERILLMQTLPKEGSFTNLKLLRVVKEDLSFTEKENKLLKFRQEGELTQWENNVVKDKDIKTGEVVNELIKKQLVELDKQEKLNENHVTLYEKFVT